MIQALDDEKKEVRVFVSSTFIDLKEERDYIVRRTFPRLAEYCRKRGILFTGVDLRWGITEEQSKEGRTIRLCLDEIKKCQPFFINILGQRYGWIPTKEDLEKDELLKENYKHLIDRALNDSISITEMEIIEGVFNNTSEVKAFFFIGEEEYYNAKNSSLRIENEDDYKKNRLEKLKDTIRKSGFPVFENFKGKEDLGEVVYAALKKAIDEKYPMDSEIKESEKQKLKHASFALSRRNYYLENPKLLNWITKHVRENGQPLVILGGSGTGKSALLANWAAKYRQKYSNEKIIEHYVSAESQSEIDIITHILMEFQEYDRLDESIKSNKSALKSKLVEVLKANQNRIIIIIDGVNQLDENSRELNWISKDLKNVVFILSSTNSKFINPSLLRVSYAYNIRSLSKDEIHTIIKEYLLHHGKKLDDSIMYEIIENKNHFKKFNFTERLLLTLEYGKYAGHLGNPMFLRVFLDELILSATNHDINEKVHEYLNSENIEVLIKKVFNRLEEDFGKEVVTFILGHIYASRNGLSEQELRLLGEVYGISYISMVELLNNLSYYLINKEDLLDFSHDFLRNAVFNRYIKNKNTENKFRRSIVNCFISPGYRENNQDRVIEEVPYQLYTLDDSIELKKFVSDKKIFIKLSKHFPYTLYTYIRKLVEEDITFIEDFLNNAGADEELKENLADLLIKNRNYNSAEKLYKIIYHTKIMKQCKDYKGLSYIIKNIIKALVQQEKYQEAMEYAEYDLKNNINNFGENSLEVANSINNCAIVLLNQKNYDKAIKLFQKSYDLKKKYYQENFLELLKAEEKIYNAMSYDMEGNYEISSTTGKTSRKNKLIKNYNNDLRVIKLKKILESKKNLVGELSSETGSTYLLLGDFYMLRGKKYEAEHFYKKALKCFKDAYGEGHLVISDIYIKIKEYKKAWIIRQSNLGLNHPETLKVLELYKKAMDCGDDLKDTMTSKFLEYIQHKSLLPELEQVDTILEEPKKVKQINKMLSRKYYIPVHTSYFSIYLLFMALILPLKWYPVSQFIFNIQILVLGYISGRNKNYFSLLDMALFSFIPYIMINTTVNANSVGLSFISYLTIFIWLHKYNFNAAFYLSTNFAHINPNLIVSLAIPGRSFLSIGIFRYLLFMGMFLLALYDLKFEETKRNLDRKLYYGGIQ